MGFGIDLRARSRKGKGLFRRAPDPRELADRLGRLLPRTLKGWDRKTSQAVLHPAAPPVRVTLEGAELVVRGETWQVGPGYHADVLARLAPLVDELDLTWDAPTLAAIQDAMCAWLAGELRGGRTRFVDRPFLVEEAAVLTPLGPRNAAWRDAVVAEPRRAADALAWWDEGPGRAARSRALLALWNEVPWREPLDDAERDLLGRVDEDLAAARKAGLDVPALEAAQLAGVDLPAGPKIGYRRHDLEVDLSGGWTVRLGGAFVGAWADDGARDWATDGDRAIDFQSLTANHDTDSEQLLAAAPEVHPVIERLVEGTRRGRAEAYTDGDVRIVIGLVTEAPHVGILTCKGGDDAWALATWQSLRRG